MVTLRLVGGTDVTGIPRRRPRGTQGSKNQTNAKLTPIPVGAILAAQIEAHETGVCGSEYGIFDTATMENRSEAEREATARKILRSLKLPGETKTVTELLAELDRNACDDTLSHSERDYRHFRISIRLHDFGMKVIDSKPHGGEYGNRKFTVVLASCGDKLLDACPELDPYVDVMCFFTL